MSEPFRDQDNRPDQLLGQEAHESAAETLRQRAATALRQKRFDLAEALLQTDDPKVHALVEDLRVYQAELEIQNEELTRSQRQSQDALARFSSFFSGLPIAGLVIDRQGLVRETNLAARQLFRLNQSHLHQHFFARLIAESDRGPVVDAWTGLPAGERLELVEIHFLNGKGDGFIGDLHIAPLPQSLDSPAQFVCAVIDRTEPVRQRLALLETDRQLRESQERYRILAEYSPDWEYWVGADGQYGYISPACLTVTGYAAEAFMRDPGLLERRIHRDDLDAWRSHTEALTLDRSTRAGPLQFRIRARSGEIRWIEHVCRPVVTEDGRHLGRRGVNRDITERKQAEALAARLSELYNALIDCSQAIVRCTDPDRLLTEVCRIATRLGGIQACAIALLTEGEAGPRLVAFHGLSRQTAELSIADGARKLPESAPDPGWYLIEHGRVAAGLAAHLDARQELTSSVLYPLLRNGRAIGLMLFYAAEEPFFTPDVARLLSEMSADISFALDAYAQEAARRQAEAKVQERERYLSAILGSAQVGIGVSEDRRVREVNAYLCRLLGYSREELIGVETRGVYCDDEAYRQVDRAIGDGPGGTGVTTIETRWRHKDGHPLDVLLGFSPLDPEDPERGRVVSVLDITDRKRFEEKLEYLAHHDPLTGLPNRTLFQLRLEHCIEHAKRDGHRVGLLFLDLDRFKVVNDTLGHPVGDSLLQGVAASLAREVRSEDTIARLGGDEFVVILEDIPAPRFAAIFAERLLKVFEQPLRVQDRELFASASVGISVFPDDAEDIDTLLRHADIAMYQAKSAGRNSFSFFDRRLTEGAIDRLRLEHDLHGAMQRGELLLHFQPQLSLTDGRLCGVEALCRWRHPRLGMIPPDVFVPIAEDIGLIDELGAWVLEEGCRQLCAWDRIGLRIPRLAVNLSVREIERQDLIEQIEEILGRTGIAPGRLELEVTESMIMRRAEEAIAALQALRSRGITLAVDDFGTGYSSLAYLKRLPLNRLKIDRAFVERLTEDPNDDAIVRAVIALSQSLGLETIAEGVESREQADFLRRAGCTEAQGYLFSRPLPASELATASIDPS